MNGTIALYQGGKVMSGSSADTTFVGYEYRDLTVGQEMESLYTDGYQSFGWIPANDARPHSGMNKVTLQFKRDRRIRNKAELTRLQRQFDACVSAIQDMEKSKESNATLTALAVGIIGTAFMAGSTFAVLAENTALSIILAVPAFTGWILPYFLYRATYAKRSAVVAPTIESAYDELYEVCKRASSLLGH